MSTDVVQELRVEVCTEPRSWSPALELRSVTDGASFSLPLDPEQPGFFSATTSFPTHRWLDVELRVDGDVRWRRVLELTDPEQSSLSLLVDQGGPVTRVAWIPWAGAEATAGNAVSLVVAFGWGGLCFGAVGWLALRVRSQRA